MTFIGVLLFSIVQLIFFSGLVFLWIRLKKESSTDIQWSRNFQIIQSKIAVFEDLSDRTETQVKQLTTMMENKIFELQNKIDEADTVLNKISNSMKKSMEVAQIFQDKIPHEEIIERQNTLKFVKAAILANEGKSIEEIKTEIDLPHSQIEFIVKVNAEKLSFDLGQIPDWLQSELHKDISPKAFNKAGKSALRPLEQILNQKQKGLSSVVVGQALFFEEVQVSKETRVEKEISGSEIKSSINDINSSIENLNVVSGNIKTENSKTDFTKSTSVRHLDVRPVVFPKIEKPFSQANRR